MSLFCAVSLSNHAIVAAKFAKHWGYSQSNYSFARSVSTLDRFATLSDHQASSAAS